MASTRRTGLLAAAAVAAATTGAVLPAAAAHAATPPPQVVTVGAGGGTTRISTHDVSQGWTTFQASVPAAAHRDAYVQVFALRGGVSLARLQRDLDAATEGEDDPRFTLALERDTIDYGGTDVLPGETGTFADDLASGTYYVANVNKPTSSLSTDAQKLVVHSTFADARAPKVASTVTMRNMRFFTSTPTLPAAGTIRVTSAPTNDPDDLHFLLLIPAKAGTTDAEVQAYFDSGSHQDPPFLASGPAPYTGIYTPGVSNAWTYTATPGTYVLICFITDPETGMEHAAMGMHKVVTLT